MNDTFCLDFVAVPLWDLVSVVMLVVSENVSSALQRLYREKGENLKHNYTVNKELPELVQAKINAQNISEVKLGFQLLRSNNQLISLLSLCVIFFFFLICSQNRYKESWMKLRDGGYKLRLDAIPFQSAKASSDILSDVSSFSQN